MERIKRIKDELINLKTQSYTLIDQYFNKISTKLDVNQMLKEEIPELKELLKQNKKDPIKLEKLFNGKADSINFKISDVNLAIQGKVQLENKIKVIQQQELNPEQNEDTFEITPSQLIQQSQGLSKVKQNLKKESSEISISQDKISEYEASQLMQSILPIKHSQNNSVIKNPNYSKNIPTAQRQPQNFQPIIGRRNTKRILQTDSSSSDSEKEFSIDTPIKKREIKQIKKLDLNSKTKDIKTVTSEFKLNIQFKTKNTILEGLDSKSLFFFENFNTVRYITFENDWKTAICGEILDKYNKKHRDTFAITQHQFIQVQTRQKQKLSVMFGIDQNFIEPILYLIDAQNPFKIKEYYKNLTEDQESEIDHKQHQRSDYALKVFKNEIFVIGGISSNIRALNYEMSYDIILKDNQNFKINYQPHDLKGLSQPRRGHSIFIVGDYLFVIFGRAQTNCEYIKLSMVPEDRKFKTIEIKFQTDYDEFDKAVVFKERNDHKSENVFFIGGSFKQKRSGNNLLQLNQIKVVWGRDQYPQFIEVSKVPTVQSFEYRPPKNHQRCLEFSQRLKSKLYNEDMNIWYFIDDEQQLIIYDVGKKKFYQKCCKQKTKN
ncbi:UNKNOWN [Stylonychia lemnae]|uniref:Kelch motif family protein n=1 Tax=Stylonychia lemnae TaxID=5949 RepID=A0A077ZYE2_STYLE|nr:UNKNOWN [Stylonychia lemnae]|eukprot:CDW73561.1 UNKNOWN [Stylonychia lemnae]